MRILILVILTLTACTSQTVENISQISAGDIEIDKVRRLISEVPTNETNFRSRAVLLFNWVGILQQQGADLISFYKTDSAYYSLERKLARFEPQVSSGEDATLLKISAWSERESTVRRKRDVDKIKHQLFSVIDNAYSELEKIQNELITKGPIFSPFEGPAPTQQDKRDIEWPKFQGDIHNTGNYAGDGPTTGREKWKFPVGLGWYARPVIENGRVYIASPGLHNTGFCIDLKTGNQIWNSTQEHVLFGIYKYPAIMSTPIIINDQIVVREVNSHGGNTGQAKNLVFIDKESGKTIMHRYAGHVDYRTQYAPVSTNGMFIVYPFGVHDIYGSPPVCQNFNRLICSDKENSKPLWDFNVGDIDALAEPVLNDDKVFQGTTEGYLYALSLKAVNNDSRVVWKVKTRGMVNTQVALSENMVIFGSNDGSVYCVEESSGKIIWKTDLTPVEYKSRKHFSTPLISGNNVYIGSANKYIYSLDITSGQLNWKFLADDWIRSKPVKINDQLILATLSGHIYCLSNTGEMIWNKKISTHPIYADLTDSDDVILITDSNLYLYAIKPDGSVIWKKSILSAFENAKGERIITDQLSGGTYYQSKPTASEGRVFFGTPSGFLYANDAETGEEIWKFEMGGAISVGAAIYKGMVFAGQQGGERFFYCLDARTGDLKWKQTLPGGWVWGSAVVDDGLVYVPTVSGYAVCLDAENGNIVWMYPTALSVPAEPAIEDDLVYFGSWSRSLYAFNKKTGEIVWKVNGITLDSGTLIAKDGKIYVPHHNNILMSFDAKTGELVSVGNKDKNDKGLYSNFNASPAFGNTRAFFTARVGNGLVGVPLTSKVYCIDPSTAKVLWTFPDGGGLSAPALADGKVYIASGNTPFFFCLDQVTGKPLWIFKLGNRVEESTLCLYKGKAYVLSADGYIHAIE